MLRELEETMKDKINKTEAQRNKALESKEEVSLLCSWSHFIVMLYQLQV